MKMMKTPKLRGVATPLALVLLACSVNAAANSPSGALGIPVEDRLRGSERAPDIVEVVRQNGMVRELTVTPAGRQAYRLVHGDPVDEHRCLEFSDRLLPSWQLVRF